MSSRYAIESVFRLVDQVTAPTSKIGKALDKMGIKSKALSNALNCDFDKAAERLDKFGKAIKKATGYMAAATAAAAGAGIAIAAKQFIEFENVATAASAKFKDVDLTTPEGYEKYQQVLKDVQKTAREVAAVTEYNAVDTAGALDKMAMAGISSSLSMKLLKGTTNLATAAGMDLTTTVDIATDALGAFGFIGNGISEDQVTKNLNRVSDVMAKTTNMFNTDMAMMFEAIQKGAPTFTAVGQTIEDFSAMVGVLASSGVKGAEAGTQLRNVIASLSAPSSAAQKAIEKLGISVSDSRGNMRNIIDIMGQFETAFGENVAKEFKRQVNALQSIEGVSMEQQIDALYDRFSAGMTGNTQKMADLNTIFGKRTVTSMLLMLAEGSEGLRQYSQQLQNAGGTAERIAEAMRGSLKNKIEVLKSSLTELGFKFIDAFVEKGGAAISRLTDAVNAFDVSPLIEIAQSVIDVISGLIGVFMNVIKKVWQFRGVITAILVPIALYQGALMGIHFAFEAIRKAKLAYSVTLGIAKIAQWAFNAALTANPIGVIIMAVAALIGLIILLAKNWNKITTAIKNNVNKVMAVLTILLGPIGIVISMIKEIASNFGRIKDALSATGLFDKIKEIGTAIKSFIQPAIDWLVGVWEAVRNAVMGFFSKIKSALQSFFEPVIQWFGALWAKVTGFFKSIFDAVATFVQPALQWIALMWQKIVGFFKDNAIVNAIKVIGGTLLSGILVPIQGLLEILSHIPGLGHLAGKGAEKIQEFRNFLKGVDGATVTADVNMPDKVAAELSPSTGTSFPATPDYGAMGYSGGAALGAGGRSKLHGVVDVLGGAIPSIPGAETVRAATGGADAAVNSGIPETLTRTGFEITAILRKIDSSVAVITHNAFPSIAIPGTDTTRAATGGADTAANSGIPETLTRTGFEIAAILRKIDSSVAAISHTIFPRITMNADGGDTPEYISPRNIAPITQAERTAYNYSERMERLIIEVAAEKGTSARIVRAPRDTEIQLVHSGGNL